MVNNGSSAFKEFEQFEMSASHQLSRNDAAEIIKREKARRKEGSRPTKKQAKVIPIRGVSKISSNSHTYKPMEKTDIISLKAEIKQRQKDLKRQIKEAKKAEKAKQKRVARTAREIQKNVHKTIEKEDEFRHNFTDKTRLTTPKKRNVFSRLHLANKYGSEEFEFIKDEIDMIKSGELPESAIEEDWKDIQKYEDAKDDVWLRRGWTAFRVTLTGLLLAGSLFACKTLVENEIQHFNDWKTQMSEQNRVESVEYTAKRAESATLRGTDQALLYELTDGEPTLENWEALPAPVRNHLRNPITAAEAAYNHNSDQSHFYIMVDGEITTEKWEALPDELKEFIREPAIVAKEYFENGKDQAYLYQLSRGAITEEFWRNLPYDVRQYVRNPVELAKQFAIAGDDLGYLKAMSLDENNMERVEHLTWQLLPDELKEYVKDPKLIIEMNEKMAQTDEEGNLPESRYDMER